MDIAWICLIAFTIPGTLISFWGLMDSIVDLHCIRLAGTNGDSKAIVWMHIRAEAVRLFYQGSGVVTGFINTFDNRVEIPSEYKQWITGVMVIGAFLLLVLSVADRRARLRLLRLDRWSYVWDGVERRKK
jgi:hypothetical protein